MRTLIPFTPLRSTISFLMLHYFCSYSGIAAGVNGRISFSWTILLGAGQVIPPFGIYTDSHTVFESSFSTAKIFRSLRFHIKSFRICLNIGTAIIRILCASGTGAFSHLSYFCFLASCWMHITADFAFLPVSLRVITPRRGLNLSLFILTFPCSS